MRPQLTRAHGIPTTPPTTHRPAGPNAAGRPRLRRALASLATLALTLTAVLATSEAPAQAVGFVRECKAYSVACISFSGYAGTSVWGYPVSSSGNNCVNYVAYRLRKNGVAQQSAMGNAGSWATNAKRRGFLVNRTPAIGSIAQWNYGSVYAPTYGHVGYVEEVTSSYIVVSDSAWSGYSSRMKLSVGDRNWPSNFIHFKDQGYQPPPSGTFIKVRETGQAFRLVGRAPVFISTWTGFGGTKPTFLVSSTTLPKLPLRPANGTFIRGAQRGEVYQIVGGAPVFVSSWIPVGGAKPYVTVDQLAIDRAGSASPYNHLLYRPADGALIKAGPTGATYKVLAGHPTLVAPSTGAMVVDPAAVSHAGDTSAIRWTHLLSRR